MTEKDAEGTAIEGTQSMAQPTGQSMALASTNSVGQSSRCRQKASLPPLPPKHRSFIMSAANVSSSSFTSRNKSKANGLQSQLQRIIQNNPSLANQRSRSQTALGRRPHLAPLL